MKYIILFVLFAITLFPLASPTKAVINDISEGSPCRTEDSKPLIASDGQLIDCKAGLSCLPNPNQCVGCAKWTCQPADDTSQTLGRIVPPPQVLNLGFGNAGISQVLTNVIQIIYIAAGIVFIFMVLISALQWIMSGGDKEAISKARGRLTYAIIGIVLLALAFLIIRLIGQITGFTFFAR
ncbi:MAG: pilin [Patescibacteria group bacterium]|nr:pilin [Patescibacteria group bacterium]